MKCPNCDYKGIRAQFSTIQKTNFKCPQCGMPGNKKVFTEASK